VDSIFKTLFPGEVLTGYRALADIHHNISVGLTNTNKHFWRCCQQETVKRELLSITNLVPYFSLDFIFFLSSHLLLSLWDHLVPLLSILSCTLKRKL
jgi:hypothetical protein